MNELRLSMGQRLVILVLVIFSMPLILGGLIAVGESGDGQILFYGTVFFVICGLIASLGRLIESSPNQPNLITHPNGMSHIRND